ncbi:hypothetical protein EPI10_004808 [Gossypium australe]|uniref:Uncharacterized protein n=1 Tax=Gossypium australe TaxID=47621 RepID=A0A5B6WMR6_9ROSI|nr:hypothetical protein EPI10_004808 [Gossypium australe]
MHYCDISHFKAAKRLLRYIKRTTNFGVWVAKENPLKLIGYTDSDWAGSVDEMRSTSKYFFSVGFGGEATQILRQPVHHSNCEESNFSGKDKAF